MSRHIVSSSAWWCLWRGGTVDDDMVRGGTVDDDMVRDEAQLLRDSAVVGRGRVSYGGGISCALDVLLL